MASNAAAPATASDPDSDPTESAPLQLLDVNPAVSCCGGETKIFLLSSSKLESDVQPIFILYDPAKEQVVYNSHHELVGQLRQPDACTVFNQMALIFNAPRQNYEVIRRISQLGLCLHVTVYRLSDRRMAATSFPFRYLEHISNDSNDGDCAYCSLLATQPRPRQVQVVTRDLSSPVEPVPVER